ncbi:PIN domain-containing protein [Truepera radiovictrix]|uniref:PilT protein domain protein n=1 Tax=Truepera radiovictrix (strain DSM 17093 / CIP 108686 / LMG 22925 / RQ-24) TaxID=649638 RepID=D7CUS9_TRURR|nr:PIN domain-containing protein [Truepera radiovictrix]ADI14070.1 PilT protein domain protein [Truepera radiovictrix DSM 17093]WMT57368.1 PIN domain-containing protein [Truepera radiovictrix]
MSVSPEFVDTNILLYAVDHSEPEKQARAAALLSRLWEARSGCLSVQVLQEFYVNATRKLSKPLDVPTARQAVEDYSLWVVHAPTSASVLAAIDLQAAHQLSFWDAMVLNSALELGASTLWSEDLNAGQYYGDTVVRSPFV